MESLEEQASDHIAVWKIRHESCIGSTRTAYRKDKYVSGFITGQCACITRGFGSSGFSAFFSVRTASGFGFFGTTRETRPIYYL